MNPWMLRAGNWFEAGGWVGPLAILIGGVFLYGGITSLSARYRLYKLSAQADGEIVTLTHHTDRDRLAPQDQKRWQQRWVAQGRFTLPDGQPVEFSQTWLSIAPLVKEGERVSVRYDPNEPTTAEVSSITGGFGSPLAVAAFGGLCVFAGVAWLGRVGLP